MHLPEGVHAACPQVLCIHIRQSTPAYNATILHVTGLFTNNGIVVNFTICSLNNHNENVSDHSYGYFNHLTRG